MYRNINKLFEMYNIVYTCAHMKKHVLKNKLIDGIIKEPLGGAHTFPEKMYKKLKSEIKKNINSLNELENQERIDKRIKKFCDMGVYKNT